MINNFFFKCVTLFGLGNISKIPGTLASLVTSIFFYLFLLFGNIVGNWYSKENIIIFYIIFLFFSYFAIEKSKNYFKEKDAKEIVIDEVCGQSLPFITLILYINMIPDLTNKSEIAIYAQALKNLNIHFYAILSFFLFRFFDILKPFPISYFDKNFKNSFGILFDDILAGIAASLIILIPLIFAFN